MSNLMRTFVLLLSSLLNICVTPTEKIYVNVHMCVCADPAFFFILAATVLLSCHMPSIMGLNTCTCHYITVGPILFSPSSLLSCFLSSFFSIPLSLSDCFCLQLSLPVSFCLTLSCRAHNFICVCLCVGWGNKIPAVVTLQ